MKYIAQSLLYIALSFSSVGMAATSAPSLVHANRLVIEPPAGFSAVRSERGFRLRESGSLRSPHQIDVTLSSLPPARGLERRSWGSEQMVYHIDKGEGGSGGDQYRLWAAKFSEPFWIVVTATVQREGSAPTFTEARGLLKLAYVQGGQK